MARLQLPIPKIINGVVNGPTAANTTCSFDVIQNKTITGVDVTATVVTVANAGVKANRHHPDQHFGGARLHLRGRGRRGQHGQRHRARPAEQTG